MKTEVVQSSLGPVPVWRRGSGTRLLLIRGAYAPDDQLEWLDPPGTAQTFVRLPGMHAPLLNDTSSGVGHCGGLTNPIGEAGFSFAAGQPDNTLQINPTSPLRSRGHPQMSVPRDTIPGIRGRPHEC